MDPNERRLLYLQFQEAFPIESLKEMPIEKYTNLKRDGSFCYWLESKTYNLGSIWGGSSFKFGIYRYVNRPKESVTMIQSDDKYAWYSKYNKDTAIEAYHYVRDSVVSIAEHARNGELEAIDKIDTFGEVFKWKIAFMYADETLVPIYKRDMLELVAEKLGMNYPKGKSIPDIQRFLMLKKGDKDLYEFYNELLNILSIAEVKENEQPYNKQKKTDGNTTQSDSNVKYWLYAPGENAIKWNWCQHNNMMCIGWQEIGNLSKYNSLEEVRFDMQKVYNNPDTSFKNAGLAVWEFIKIMKPGDIVIAKQGRSKIIGKGIITGEYVYDSSLGEYCNVRQVKWTHIGGWEAPQDLAMKTLTDISKYPELVNNIESLFAPEQSKQYWWLVANPKIWTLSDMKIGEVQDYTLYNDDGHQRRVFQNFLNAKTGDLVIGYESNPKKQMVAILEIAKENDGKNIWFRKKESLGTPIGLATLKDIPELQKMEFIVNPHGSLFKLSEYEYNAIIDLVREDNPITPVTQIIKYSDKDFLDQVYVQKEDLETLKSLLLRKKNLILQGAPGVGKTFAAKRLAYAIMGEIDDERIEQVQFHQNYSYEDFMMGFKPNEEGGFDLQTGVFYNFCKRAAAADSKKPYFFIIDEINRGNLSKIFGELLMLIEDDYRDKPIKLSYRDEKFAVPSNLHIIGMMNTADRSLAMIDYALRRRFSFFEMKPGFESDSFKNYLNGIGDEGLRKVVDAVIELNNVIINDDSLGSGFSIGHSYFCNLKSITNNILSDIVEYDIIPMLREYWFDNDNKFKEESQKLIDALK